MTSPRGSASHLQSSASKPASLQRSSSYNRAPCCQNGACEHGTLSPRARGGSNASERSGSKTLDPDENHEQDDAQDAHGQGGAFPGSADLSHNILGDALADGILGDGEQDGNGKGGSTTSWLARRHGVVHRRLMYLAYYFPFTNWIRQYRWSYLRGDCIAAITMASFYLPMALSYASNLGHIPPINGLYAFVFNPFIYGLLGTCPQMVVGPEAAGSLLVGQVVRDSVDAGESSDDDNLINAQIAGVVTGMAGALILVAGLFRLGYVDSVLSRPFLRGFISAIGFVILIGQLIPEMGLAERAKEVGGVSHGSSVVQIWFLLHNLNQVHRLSCGVGLGSLAIIMVLRSLKKRLQSHVPSAAYFPDRFIIVVLSTVLTWKLGWDKKGLEILGEVQSSTGSPFTFRFPLRPSHMHHVRQAMSTSFLIALLGFFESSVAGKSLGGGEGKDGGLQGVQLSANRELVALGVANTVGGCFMALPAFGGYARSKLNASTGGKTPMSSIILSIIAVICVLFLLPYLYYLPKAVLSSMISAVAYSLIEEIPHDIKFFLRIRGWWDLALMIIIFVSTMFYSLQLGIALGIGFSLLSVIHHATKPRIQILGKVPGTDLFENAEDNPQGLEFFRGCLIVKIPEPLTFANTGALKSRLRKLEMYGTEKAHPALPRVRDPEHNKNIIFDVHGVTSIDGSGTQVLTEIVDEYVNRGERVFFCRVPKESNPVFVMFERSGIVEKCGGRRHFVKSVDEAIRMTELESLSDLYRDEGQNGNAV